MQRLAIAIGVIQESSRALIGMWPLLIVPCLTMLFMILMVPLTLSGLFCIVR